MNGKIRALRFVLVVLLATLVVAACSRATPTPTPVPLPPQRTPVPTPYPVETPPAGLPPAANLLPEGAWLYLHLEAPDGRRWTAVGYEDRDEVYDERNNQTWVDRGRFLSRYQDLWYALLNQARFYELTDPAYLTACEACPQIALAVRSPESGLPRGVWVRLRPYDAPGQLLPLLPMLHALSLSVETLMQRYPAGTITSTASVPPLPSDAPDVLRVLYGEELQKAPGGFRVGKSVTPWVGKVVPGSFTTPGAEELVALVGGTSPDGLGIPEDKPYLETRLVILQKQDGGTWQVVGRSDPIAYNTRPKVLPLTVDHLPDFDGDGRQEVMMVSASLLPGYLDGVYRLYRWDGDKLRTVWTTTSFYDNTTLPDQPDFATQIAWPEWQDTDGDGIKDIVLNVVRRTYARTAAGFADTAEVERETTSQVLFRWTGKGFMLVNP